MTEKPRWIRLAAAAVLGMTLCVFWSRQITDSTIKSDARQNLSMALNLRHNHVMSLSTHAPYLPTMYREPVFVFSTALCVDLMDRALGRADPQAYFQGERLRYVKYQNVAWMALLCTGTFWAVYLFTSSVYLGVLGIILVNVKLPLVESGLQRLGIDNLCSDLPAAAMLVLGCAALGGGLRSGRKSLVALAGLSFGTLALIKAAFLYVFGVAAAVLLCLYAWRRRLSENAPHPAHVGILVAAFAAVVLPWMYRNYAAFGSFQIAERGGFVLYTRAVKDRMTAEEVRGSFAVPASTDWDYPGSLALSPKSSAGWDYLFGNISPGAMVKLGSTYFLYYIGGTGATVGSPVDELAYAKLGVATSTDGVNWTKYASNPIISYSTGDYEHEGVFSVAATVVEGTIHLYYGVTHHTGTPKPNSVDGYIYHRASTDGYVFGSATLIYQGVGEEYYPLGVTHDGITYRLYFIGNNVGGPLNMISGTSPTSLAGATVISPEGWRGGGDVNFIGDDIILLHMLKSGATGVLQTRIVDTNYWGQISDPIESWVFNAAKTHQLVYLDRSVSKWFMYQFDLTGATWHDAHIDVYQATATNASLPAIRFEDFAGTGALSADWTTVRGTSISRTSGLAKGDANNNDVIRNDATFPDDQYSIIKIDSGIANNAHYARVWIGASGSGATLNGYYLTTDGTNGADHTVIAKMVDGSGSALQALSPTTPFAAGDRMKLSRHNSGASQVIRAWQDVGTGWVQIGTDVSDATFQSGGSPGFGMDDGASNDVRVDNFEGGGIQ